MSEAEQKKAQALAERIEKFATADTPQKGLAAMSDEQVADFVKAYYTNDSLNYYDEVNKRAEEALHVAERELEANNKAPYSPALIEAMVGVAKMSVMDEIADTFSKACKEVHGKLKNETIISPAAGMTYQRPLAEVMQKFSILLNRELTDECKSRGINADEFMKAAFQFIMTDPTIIFELDSFAGLKNYESVKDVPVSEEQVRDFSKQVVAYTKLLLEGKVPEMSLAVYPSLMNQFLQIKFGIDSYQVIGKIVALVKEEDQKKHAALYRQLAEEIWYVENGRALIFSILQQQMEMFAQMAAQGMDQDAMMQGMDPAMLDALMQGKIPEGMDPAMVEALMKASGAGGMPPMDQASMEAMIKGGMPPGFDPSAMEAMMKGGMPPGFDPAMMDMMSKGGMPPFDPAMLGAMQNGQMPDGMDPALAAAMRQGMEIGQKATQNMSDAQKLELMQAFQSGDLAKMEAMMPPDVRKMLEDAKKQEGPQ